MSGQVKEKFKVDAFLVFYIIHTSQVGVGVLGFQRVVMSKAGYDGWITVLITGLIFHLALILMYHMLNKYNTDLTGIQQFLFGKWVGGIFNVLFASYMLVTAFTVVQSYIEVVQVWMFPTLPSWLVGLLFCILIYYIVSGGFKVVTGMCFFGFVIPIPLVLFLIFPIQYADFYTLLPILQEPISEIFLATKQMMLSYLGIEALLIYFPFIKNAKKSQKFAHMGVAFTTILYTLLLVITFAFFSEEQLKHTVWATLSMFKVAEFSFIERLEYFAVATWVLVVLPTMILYIWASTRMLKQTFHISQRIWLVICMVILLIAISFVDGRVQINNLNNFVAQVSFYLMIIYFPIVYLLSQFLYPKYRRTSK